MRDVGIYLVNLDRSVDRLRSAAEQLDGVGIDWQRISAIDGRAQGDASAHCDKETFARHVGRNVTGGEISVYLSHTKALRAFLESPKLFALVFEDDFSIDDILAFK